MSGLECIDPELIQRANETGLRLRQAGLKVVTAESCTAGLLCAALAQCQDAGEILLGGFVTYAKAAKAQTLGVDEELLSREGAVNAAVAAQLCTGALSRSGADIALAVTGVLGPSEDEDGNPVGLIYWGSVRKGDRPRVVQTLWSAIA